MKPDKCSHDWRLCPQCHGDERDRLGCWVCGGRGTVRLTAKVVGDDGRVFGEEEAPDEA